MRALGIILWGLLALAFEPAMADSDEGSHADADPPFVSGGADTCLRCHGNPQSHQAVLSIFKTPHGAANDSGVSLAQQQCESCHGPGGDHARRLRFGEERPPILAFGKSALWPVERQNAQCLSCHQDNTRMHWSGGAHELADLACNDCHSLHPPRDPVLGKSSQAEVCFDCHKPQRNEFHRASSHPVRFGKMDCASCHEPHGSMNPASLTRATVNDTCFECHADKRGPFLWEHAPAAEDCGSCHLPHGSNHPDLLTRRQPLLCQQCHSRAGHPSVARTGSGLADQRASAFLLGNSCANCHSQVHGSNHPSGAGLMR